MTAKAPPRGALARALEKQQWAKAAQLITPAATRERDENGILPLQYAVMNNASPELAAGVLAANP